MNRGQFFVSLALLLFGCKPLAVESPNLAADFDLENSRSHFHCKDLGNGNYRPYYVKWDTATQRAIDHSMRPKGLLGQNAMKSVDECHAALEAANYQFGVICSRTGLDGWKPTLYTGTSPGRADFGYLGGSSIMNFADCLSATRHASKKGICFWGGSEWYRGMIDRAKVSGGPFRRLEDCIATTK